MKRLADMLALTPAERRVIIFLAGALILGLTIRAVRTLFASPPKFDYSATDSAFVALAPSPVDPDDMPPDDPPAPAGPVRINTATKEQLMSLPGIGETMAERILLERTDGGPFRSVEDLRRVRGIGPKRIEQLKPLVTVD